MPYEPQHHVRIVTATSLFDGHDAAINIMRRLLQSTGAEVIHLGHDRSAAEVATAAIEEDAQAVAITSYQGGHMEFFRYVRELLDEAGAGHVKIFGGGGGTILPEEGEELERSGVERIYSPDDGRELGLQGMIDDLLERADFPVTRDESLDVSTLGTSTPGLLARMISTVEQQADGELAAAARAAASGNGAPIVGITGTGGAGKSSLIDEIVVRYLADFPDRTLAIISVDPSRRRSGGALLGDRIRMNAVTHPRVFMRSVATRQANLALSPHIASALDLVKAAGFDLVILETSGIGQADTEIVDHADLSLYVMTPEYGAASQLEKVDMLDFADLIVINKADRRGADDALRDVRKQYRRNHGVFDGQDEDLPIYPTVASHFNDAGTNRFYRALMEAVDRRTEERFASDIDLPTDHGGEQPVIPKDRVRYLSEIADTVRTYNKTVNEQAAAAIEAQALEVVARRSGDDPVAAASREAFSELDPRVAAMLAEWDTTSDSYATDTVSYEVRGADIEIEGASTTLSGTRIPKVVFPRISGWGDRVQWAMQENVPGRFPYTAGVFPFKRVAEDPTRMFAGEGGPEQTNRRFHYVSRGMPAIRLSTAFDSVTLYGEDPDTRPDIYGKIGNAGVSVATLDDAKKLYSGFELLDPATSVSMTINGPAPMMLAFFLNAAIDQQCERYVVEHGLQDEIEAALARRFDERGMARPRYRGDLPPGHNGLGLMLLGITGADVLPSDAYGSIKADVLAKVRGTIQADILKEDQAQNTCIFSTEFALRMQGDIQEYFIDRSIRNFYSVSISGYHMAEAGANPITQLAFTLANGFTFVEYYLSRGMPIDTFAPNLSFFFSNGVDAEYAVIGRVARRIWAKAMRDRYGAAERSQKLKYHIQTSGRSLHAQEIAFNDIRTTLQALYAIYDNCNSLHTNAYDEAITTPTEESVRRALAIQLIINRELGLAKNENPLQGAYIIDELTDLVEEAVLAEFDRLTDRGGVLGAMELMYQRSKIQEESLRYERMKSTGELPIIGVNTFLSSEGSPFVVPDTVIRSTDEDKQFQIDAVRAVQERGAEEGSAALERLQRTAIDGGNTFAALMDAAKWCSIGQLSHALYDVGGRYRRSM
ncbi:MAG: methylmalonyl-CoA mutase family protein [Actinomycetota bacterium]